jgi:pimeloyl-ACP methyl ester carboxylesterase
MKAARSHKSDGPDVLVYADVVAPAQAWSDVAQRGAHARDAARSLHGDDGKDLRARELGAAQPEGEHARVTHAWKDTPTRTLDVNGVPFAYRELGPEGGVPVVFLHHLMAVLDDWDPRVIDGIAAKHRVVAFDNRGVGASGGDVPESVEEMGRDAIAFIRAKGLSKVDLLGFSLGGGVAQMIALQAPELVRRIILAGTGPRGGGGIEKITRVAVAAYVKAALTMSDARAFLFFPRDSNGKRAAKDYFSRLKERTRDRDKPIALQARVAQLRAIRAAGLHAPDDLSVITQPVFVANGDNDLMVASEHSADMARRLPNARLTIFPNSGHGGVFQYHREFVSQSLAFLASNERELR